MKKIDVVLGWLLIAFGTIHTVLTRKLDPTLGINAIWFASGGLLFMTVGALNLLRVAYTNVAKGVRIVSVIANIVLVALMLLIASRVPLRGNPQVVVGLVLAGVLTLLSVLRRGDAGRS
ncbi:MAG TPA: hypothetical protein VFU86_10965 [Terriglobales bacterium]|nr:hypothetical protein [Terriglobales bacterium]